MKRHFQCAEPIKSPSNLTKYCACHEILKLKISAETPWMLPPIERRFDDNPNTSDDIRRYPTTKSSSRTRRFGDLTRPSLETILYCKIQHFASRLSPKMSRSAAPVTKSHPPTSPNTAPATQNECHHWSAMLNETSFPMRGASKVTLQHHQILRLPRKMNVLDDLRHIWNVISNARSQSSHPPTSPNTAPATKSWSSRFQRKLPECFRQ